MKNKKGQVTIFIILAVVLISIAVVLVYVNQGGVSDIDKEYFSSKFHFGFSDYSNDLNLQKQNKIN